MQIDSMIPALAIENRVTESNLSKVIPLTKSQSHNADGAILLQSPYNFQFGAK